MSKNTVNTSRNCDLGGPNEQTHNKNTLNMHKTTLPGGARTSTNPRSSKKRAFTNKRTSNFAHLFNLGLPGVIQASQGEPNEQKLH